MIDAKVNMIKQQIRTWGVNDEAVIHLFERIDRRYFVAKEHEDIAYADMALPLLNAEEMLMPSVQARMLQALRLKPTETVLEIGTGSGFFTALLAGLAHHVISIEFHRDLSSWAAQNLKNQGVLNVELLVGNGANGVKLAEPTDVIVITGGLPFLPEGFKSCIKETGRILALLGNEKAMQVTLIEKQGEKINTTGLFETVTKTLLRAPEAERFVF